MEQSRYLSAFALMRNYFCKALINSSEPYSYLMTRTTKDLIKSFSIGFCPQDSTPLIEHFKKIYSQEEILNLGIFSLKDGRILNRFSNRVVFPVCSSANKVLGFVGRTVESSPFKYLKSSDTDFFKQGDLFFGLPQALPYILSSRTVFIVEGLFDVLAMHQAGIKNTIATLGTSISSSQLDCLRFYADKIFILFDGDSAGQSGAMVVKSKALDKGLLVDTLSLPIGDDPDSLFHELGKDVFRSYILSINNHQ